MPAHSKNEKHNKAIKKFNNTEIQMKKVAKLLESVIRSETEWKLSWKQFLTWKHSKKFPC